MLLRTGLLMFFRRM